MSLEILAFWMRHQRPTPEYQRTELGCGSGEEFLLSLSSYSFFSVPGYSPILGAAAGKFHEIAVGQKW